MQELFCGILLIWTELSLHNTIYTGWGTHYLLILGRIKNERRGGRTDLRPPKRRRYYWTGIVVVPLYVVVPETWSPIEKVTLVPAVMLEGIWKATR